MYRPRPFAVDELTVLQAFVRERAFATIAAAVDGHVLLAYAPVVLDPVGPLGTVRFHLARANPMATLAAGTPVTLSLLGPDAYVSPDWYVGAGLVPTWNYSAVEARGRVRLLDDTELRQMLADLSAEQEAKLAPKQPWTMEKIPEPKLQALMQAIVGFAVKLEALEGKFKLSQDKSAEDAAGAVAGLEARGASLVAAAMRRARKT